MRNLGKASTKIICMILTVVLLMGMVPSTVVASGIDEPLTGATGSGWDDFGGEPDASQWDDSSGNQGSSEDSAISAEDLDDADDSEPNASPGSSVIEEIEVATPGDTSLGMSSEGQPLPWAVNLQTMLQGPRLFSVSGVQGNALTWSGGQITFGGGTWYVGSGALYRITHSGGEAFCAEFNGTAAGGIYEESGEGSNSTIKQVIANYDASNKTADDYITAQCLIWGQLLGMSVDWGGYTPSSAITGGNADTTNFKYYLHKNIDSPHTQNIFTWTDEPGDIPPPTEPGESNTRIEVEVEVVTDVEIKNEKEFEYSDAIGQITIRKHDQDQKSLDGALFNIRVDFTDGSHILVENWEVDNGARLFTWTHPENNHDPATVTVWEVQPPRYYDGDPTPQTATVHPTYTRVTIVKEWTQTIFTYYYHYTIFEITADGEEIEIDSYDESDQQFEVTSPIIESFPDFIAGDREITVTFVNRRITGDIEVIKRDANTGQPLAGAHIHLWGEDLGDPNHIDRTIVTDANGIAYFDNLPPGTYAIQETQAPFGYNLNNEIQNAVLQSGQVIRKEVRNYRKDGLIIKKVDENGQALAGAVFELRRGSGEVLLREVTNENGIIFRDYLTDDTYVIEEISAPEGYLLDENPIQSIRIYATDDNKEYTVTFVNKKKPSIEITKVDGSTPTLKLEGATFRITNSLTGQYWDITTGADGKALLENLEINMTYIVEEKEAPEGYVNSGYRQEIVLRECRTHTLTVSNQMKPALRIIKKDADTGVLLEGATFRLAWNGGASYLDITTGANGEIHVPDLTPGTYTLTETKSPTGYILDSTERTVIVAAGEVTVVEITNHLKPSLKIIKKDKVTGALLEGATFRISWNSGADYRDVTTKADGTALVTDLNAGWYTITELKAPEGYLLDSTPNQILLNPGEAGVIELFNEAKPSLTISKIDNVTKTPLQYAKFKIELKTSTGTQLIGEYISDADGLIYLENIEPGRYLISEIEAPDGYNIDMVSHEITIEFGMAYKLEFTNTAKSPIYIQKVDEKGTPLIGAKFKVTTMNGAMVGTVTTGRTGYAIIPYAEPGWYVVEEVQAPDGYILSSTPVNVEVKSGRPAQVEFVNYKKPTLEILKLDADTQKALVGAKFKITQSNGAMVGEYSTNVNGLIVIEGLDAGSYIITEIRSPDGYILDMTPQVVSLEAGKGVRVEFYNVAKPGLQLIKLDKLTGQPVKGAMFSVVELQGGAKKDHGTFTTSENGTFYIPDLTPGHYVLTEIKAADGYILDSTAHQVYVEGGKLNTIEVYNTPYSDLRLLKIDSETRDPLAGAVFKLFDEKRLEIGTYTTSALGEIYVSGLPSGVYFLQEQKAPAGYLLDNTVRQIELLGGKTTTVEWKNTPLGSLRIVKIDSETKKPLYGVEFELFDNKNASLGRFITDQNGIITFGRNLQSGKYKIKEISVPDGYVLDDTVYTVTVKEGETTEIEIKNTPKGSLRITKIDEDTKEKLTGASFLLYDAKGNLLGEYKTNDKGEIFIERELVAGKYQIKEIKAPSGYVLDETVRTVEIKNGATTEIEIKNVLEVGNIQIIKVSDGKNSITKDKQGDGLEGAIFEIYDEKLNLVDKIKTDRKGIATSEDLPLGKYVIKEVKAPKYYFTDGKPFYAEIKVHGDLIRFRVENTPEEIEVSVEKRGVVETMAGELIRYDFSGIANKSNCSLDNFYWKDELPTDAVRIQSLTTGTWSEKTTYEVWIKTNLKGWKRIKSNLHTTTEYTIDMRPSALGLASNEYVTQYKLEFGTVEAGFHATKDPFIEVRVNNGLPMGYRFTNRTDVGGKRGDEWSYDRDSWISVVYKPDRKLPKTGF